MKDSTSVLCFCHHSQLLELSQRLLQIGQLSTSPCTMYHPESLGVTVQWQLVTHQDSGLGTTFAASRVSKLSIQLNLDLTSPILNKASSQLVDYVGHERSIRNNGGEGGGETRKDIQTKLTTAMKLNSQIGMLLLSINFQPSVNNSTTLSTRSVTVSTCQATTSGYITAGLAQQQTQIQLKSKNGKFQYWCHWPQSRLLTGEILALAGLGNTCNRPTALGVKGCLLLIGTY